MITSKKVFEFVEIFERILPYAQHDGALDMGEDCVSETPEFDGRSHKCGTIHCHAGWFCLAKQWDGESEYLPGEYVYYQRGSDLIWLHFGPYGIPGLMDKNPHIWGNRYGADMYRDKRAFISKERPDGAETLQDIVDHWGEVGIRLLIQELYEKGEE